MIGVEPISGSSVFSGAELHQGKFSAEQRQAPVNLRTLKYSIIFQTLLEPPGAERDGADLEASLNRWNDPNLGSPEI